MRALPYPYPEPADVPVENSAGYTLDVIYARNISHNNVGDDVISPVKK
ncbi:hypothetical protein U2F10_34450 [Leptothoe sp. EHU-05/26/07-4]